MIRHRWQRYSPGERCLYRSYELALKGYRSTDADKRRKCLKLSGNWHKLMGRAKSSAARRRKNEKP